MGSFEFPPMPADTARAVEGTLGARNLYRVIGDESTPLFRAYAMAQCGSFFPVDEVLSFRLTMITLFQFLESLSDSCAAEASRVRHDWKYALHLPLHFPGFSANAFRVFRCTTIARGNSSRVFFEPMRWLQERPQLLNSGAGRFDEDDIGAAVCRLSWLELTFQSISEVLTVLVSEQPEWSRRKIPLARYQRYAQGSTMPKLPWEYTKQIDLSLTIAADMKLLLCAVDSDDSAELVTLPQVQHLRRVFQLTERTKNERYHNLGCAYCGSVVNP